MQWQERQAAGRMGLARRHASQSEKVDLKGRENKPHSRRLDTDRAHKCNLQAARIKNHARQQAATSKTRHASGWKNQERDKQHAL
jgi:hypothetical protein